MQILNKLLEMLQSEFSYNEREVQWGSEYYAKKKNPRTGVLSGFFTTPSLKNLISRCENGYVNTSSSYN